MSNYLKLNDFLLLSLVCILKSIIIYWVSAKSPTIRGYNFCEYSTFSIFTKTKTTGMQWCTILYFAVYVFPCTTCVCQQINLKKNSLLNFGSFTDQSQLTLWMHFQAFLHFIRSSSVPKSRIKVHLHYFLFIDWKVLLCFWSFLCEKLYCKKTQYFPKMT